MPTSHRSTDRARMKSTTMELATMALFKRRGAPIWVVCCYFWEGDDVANAGPMRESQNSPHRLQRSCALVFFPRQRRPRKKRYHPKKKKTTTNAAQKRGTFSAQRRQQQPIAWSSPAASLLPLFFFRCRSVLPGTFALFFFCERMSGKKRYGEKQNAQNGCYGIFHNRLQSKTQ